MATVSQTMTQKEVATLFGYSEKHFSKLIRSGEIPLLRIPGTTKYSRTTVLRYLGIDPDGVDAMVARLTGAKTVREPMTIGQIVAEYESRK